MGSRKPPSAPQWQVILEEIRSENRATLEAVLTFRTTLESGLDRVEQQSQARDDLAFQAIRAIQRKLDEHGTDIAQTRVDIRENTIEVRGLSQKVDAQNRIEDRVAALEKHAFGPGGGSTPAPA
jgi:protein-disulfide isomerase-like protein with CxxC motif